MECPIISPAVVFCVSLRSIVPGFAAHQAGITCILFHRRKRLRGPGNPSLHISGRLRRGAVLCGAAAILSLNQQTQAVVGIDVNFDLGIVDNEVLINNSVNATNLYSATTFTPTLGNYNFNIPFNANYGQSSTVAVVDLGLINNSNPCAYPRQ